MKSVKPRTRVRRVWRLEGGVVCMQFVDQNRVAAEMVITIKRATFDTILSVEECWWCGRRELVVKLRSCG